MVTGKATSQAANRLPAATVSGTIPRETPACKYQEIPLGLIDAHPDNPRGDWENQDIERLVPSIKQAGIVQAVVVRPMGNRFQLVAGERRFRAAKSARLKTIPAMVKDLSNAEALAQMLIENLQRKDLNPIEKAKAIVKLCAPEEQGGAAMNNKDSAALFGKTPSWAPNMIRLLKLPEKWQRKVARGELQARAARKLTPYAESPELLAAIELDMKANPWAWRTAEDFERSLAIIVANPAALGKGKSAPIKPKHRRASSATKATAEPTATAVARSVSGGEDCQTRLGLEEICSAISEVKSLEELDIVQLALECRRESLNHRPTAS